MSLKFIKMFQLPDGNITHNPTLPNSLGFNEHADFLIKKYEDQFHLVLLRDAITPGTLVKKVVSQASFTTSPTSDALAGSSLVAVQDASGFIAGKTLVNISGDPTNYSVSAINGQVVTLSPQLTQTVTAATGVINGTYPGLTYAGHLEVNAARGTNVVKLANPNLVLAPNVALQFASDTTNTVYTILTMNADGTISVTPALKQGYTTGALVISDSLSTAGGQLTDSVKAGSTKLFVTNSTVFVNGDMVVIGNDAVQYQVMSSDATSITLNVGVADNYPGQQGPYVVRDYYLYTPSGVPVRKSPLKLNIDKDIISVAYDSSSKLQYFLMSYVDKNNERKYYIIRGDLTSQVFDFSTRSLDLNNLVGYPRDIAIYQNGVFILTDQNIVHMYSLKGTHRQKIEFNNFKSDLRSLDYFADYVSSYTHLGSLYSGLTTGSGAVVVDNSSKAGDFPSAPYDSTYDGEVPPLKFQPTNQGYKGWFKLPEFATLDVFSDEPWNDDGATSSGNGSGSAGAGTSGSGTFATRKYVLPIDWNTTTPPPDKFPLPIWHQAPRGIILEGPLANATYDPWHVLDTPPTAGTGGSTGSTTPTTPPVPKEYSIVDPSKRSFVHEFSLREYCVADGLLEPLSNFYKNTLGVIASVESGQFDGLRLTAIELGDDDADSPPVGISGLSSSPKIGVSVPHSTLLGGTKDVPSTGLIGIAVTPNKPLVPGTPAIGSFTIGGVLSVDDSVGLVVQGTTYTTVVKSSDSSTDELAARLAVLIKSNPTVKVTGVTGSTINLASVENTSTNLVLDKVLSHGSKLVITTSGSKLTGGIDGVHATGSVVFNGQAGNLGIAEVDATGSFQITMNRDRTINIANPELAADPITLSIGGRIYTTEIHTVDGGLFGNIVYDVCQRLADMINAETNITEVRVVSVQNVSSDTYAINLSCRLGPLGNSIPIAIVPYTGPNVDSNGVPVLSGVASGPKLSGGQGSDTIYVFVGNKGYVTTGDNLLGPSANSIAEQLALQINGDTTSPVVATVVGGSLNFEAKAVGVEGNSIPLNARTLSTTLSVVTSSINHGVDFSAAIGEISVGGVFDRTSIVKVTIGNSSGVSTVHEASVFPTDMNVADIADRVRGSLLTDPLVYVSKQIGSTLYLVASTEGSSGNDVTVDVQVSGKTTATVVISETAGVNDIPAVTAEGSVVSVIVNGQPFTYEVKAYDTSATIAASLAASINGASTTLVPNQRYADRNKFLNSTKPETYINKNKFLTFIGEVKQAYTDALIAGPYSATNYLDAPVLDGSVYPINKSFARWLLLYDNAGYVFIWDLILNKIIRSTRTGMHYHTNRTACNLGIEKRPDVGQDEGVNRDEIKAQLLPHFGAGTGSVNDGVNAVIDRMITNNIAELDISSSVELNFKTWDDYLDALLDAPVVMQFQANKGEFDVRVGSGTQLNWRVKRTLEGVKSSGIDLDKSSFLSLHDYGTLATPNAVGQSLVIMEQDNFTPVISSNPNGIALVSHELRNENPQFTFTIKLWGNVGEPIIRQRVYVEMGIYNSNATVDPQAPVWNPDPIFIFSDDRGLATGTFPMPEIPVEGHILLRFSVQAIAQPDKEDLYMYDINPTFVAPGDTVKIKLWRPDPVIGSARVVPSFDFHFNTLSDGPVAVTATPIIVTADQIAEAQLDIFTVEVPASFSNQTGIVTVYAYASINGTIKPSNGVIIVLRQPLV
jgi:phage tail sheath gpL-like